MRARHILIVDANPAAALVTQRGLHRFLAATVDVAIAASPDNAWLQCASGAVDLLIVDPHPMSSESLRLICAVRTYRPRIPILVLTAYDTPGVRARMGALGVTDYVAKPVALPELVPLVRRALSPGGPHSCDLSTSAVSARLLLSCDA